MTHMSAPAVLADAVLYEGVVIHRRHKPKSHHLRYRVFYMLLDIDRVKDIAARSRMFAAEGGRGIFRFLNQDHGPGQPGPLRPWVTEQLTKAGVDIAGGAIRLLAFPRVFGYVFNPLSIYFCYDPSGVLRAILYEVTNTFRERHTYVFPVEAGGDETLKTHKCQKEMYVSPFIELDCEYGFKIVPPGETVAIAIRQKDLEGPLLDASFTGKALPFNDQTLRRLAFKFPFLTLKVMGAIHWEALKLWCKGIGLVTHSAPPTNPVSIVDNSNMTGVPYS